MIVRKIPVYNTEISEVCEKNSPEFLKGKFSIRIPRELLCACREKVILSFPGALEIRIIKRSYTDDTDDITSLKREKCFCFNEENEFILEAECIMKTSDGKSKNVFFVRLPMSAPFMENADIDFCFDGTWLRFLKNGRILNENSGLENFCRASGEFYVDEGVVISSIANITVDYCEEKTDMNAGFYFPDGWNTNVGDVMTFSHDGVCHIMYLHDRRNHGSRNGQGVHYIAHMISDNLKDWYEQVPVVQIDAPWKTFGTGTMIFHKGKYYMTYGLHTERYPDDRDKTEPVLGDDGFCAVDYKDIFEKGGLPAGASYSVSDNGIDFTASEKLIHASRNPSSYVNENGEILMYCGYGGDGVWSSSGFDSPFRKCEGNFIFSGKDVVMQNSSECPAFVNWNGYRYLIVGFTGYYRTFEKNSDKFEDASVMGENIYDGLCVPMVYEFGNNRRIIAGWIKSPDGWGGALVQRELVQEEGGKLGMKWVPELTPEKTGENLTEPISDNYILEINVVRKNAKRFGIVFSKDESACILQIDFEKKRAQFADTVPGKFAAEISTACEQMKEFKNPGKSVNIPHNCKNYSVPDVDISEKEFAVRIISRYSKRMKATVLDAEIAGKRTMLTVREKFIPDRLSFISEGEVTVRKRELHRIK